MHSYDTYNYGIGILYTPMWCIPKAIETQYLLRILFFLKVSLLNTLCGDFSPFFTLGGDGGGDGTGGGQVEGTKRHQYSIASGSLSRSETVEKIRIWNKGDNVSNQE